MHLGALEGSLRPGRPPGTILKSIKVIWIDFVQNEKSPFFRDFGPETGFRGRLVLELTSRGEKEKIRSAYQSGLTSKHDFNTILTLKSMPKSKIAFKK